MKVYVLTYCSERWDFQNSIQCLCKRLWEVEVCPTREAAEAAAKGHMFPTIYEREVGV